MAKTSIKNNNMTIYHTGSIGYILNKTILLLRAMIQSLILDASYLISDPTVQCHQPGGQEYPLDALGVLFGVSKAV